MTALLVVTAVLLLLGLLVLVAVLAYRAGRTSMIAHSEAANTVLEAAQAVDRVTSSSSKLYEATTVSLDGLRKDIASLSDQLKVNTEVVAARTRDVTDVVETLFAGFERAGFVKPEERHSTRQVGEGEATGE